MARGDFLNGGAPVPPQVKLSTFVNVAPCPDRPCGKPNSAIRITARCVDPQAGLVIGEIDAWIGHPAALQNLIKALRERLLGERVIDVEPPGAVEIARG